MEFSKDSKFHQQLVIVNGTLPAVLVAIDWWRGNLGANPAEFVTRATGVMTLVFLVLTLMVTPLRKLFGWNWLLKQRRLIGLFAFYYGCAHLLTYFSFDRDWHLLTVWPDILKRRFIAVGMISFLLMVPLAATSTNAMIKRLGGKRWRQLHRLTYYVAIGGVIHYLMIVKSDIRYPMAFAIAVVVLLGYRVVDKGKPSAKTA
ncbi:sulfoxide reductase heme-binding subunit YedZ [Luteolibacter pohnpeiensis]|uniref:Protein-methionine-sulfoxide reductase heme-binding subunit MsrQ n=1 Tax=Luteolibacter pohnpeiensis TaxID=454153 RepID=A0A934S4Q9_9BACT|nr:protein-methionine-sulfoxide reductase heme-binding subunit MsrQ [Luteolibacter pohnpeiensis]MBK1882242.1 sulfoxide reductase heme-binding subunit YedZ [Luteolibacter pohnpeiensis]